MPRNQEVMWPRLVANKILRKRLGSNNFVADLPSNKENRLSEIPTLNHSSLSSKSYINLHKDVNNYKIFVSTWNVGGVEPCEDLDMGDFLDTGNTSCDIYVLGFQEIVPLRASNVLGSENSKISMKWNSLIREALNKNNRQKLQHSEDNGKLSVEDYSIPGQDYRCIISKQMVGILISVWVRSYLCPYIRSSSVSCVGCGIMGCLGNKGSVSVRFQLYETSFCFVCSHLASGCREGDERLRNSNVSEIFARTSFPRGQSLDLPRKILDHDRVIFLGDLNYRISLPESTVRQLVERRDWNSLLENDQLRMELIDGQFEGWHEGSVIFAPTYKYRPNSDVYYGCFNQTKKGEKKRAPAWCDRIIWYGKGWKQHEYKRGEAKLSDHRPVKATFSAEVVVLHPLKQFQSFFLSDRFDRITSQLDLSSSTDDFLCKGRSSFQI